MARTLVAYRQQLLAECLANWRQHLQKIAVALPPAASGLICGAIHKRQWQFSQAQCTSIDVYLPHPQEKDATVIQKQYGGVEGLAKALRSNTTEGIHTDAAGGTSVESRQAAYGFNRCSPVTPIWSSRVSARRGVDISCASSAALSRNLGPFERLLSGCAT
jgi:hypothetical protein